MEDGTSQNWKNFIAEARTKYMEIGHIACPAFGNEKIYFTEEGFRHLLYKGRNPRERSEQIRRIVLVPHAPGILASSFKFSVYERTYKNSSVADFWSFVGRSGNTGGDGKFIIVIVRQLRQGPKHFFSVFDDMIQ